MPPLGLNVFHQSSQALGEVADSLVSTVPGAGFWWSWIVLRIHIDDKFDVRAGSTYGDGPRLGVSSPGRVGVGIWVFSEQVSCEPRGSGRNAIRLVNDEVGSCTRYITILDESYDR